ncbi:fumarylacetoacetate hydrolase family protein [Corynebacterium sp. ES2794-CONJ1]|uniref:fumarylacetoacetate hydrolase family protein n=1 Tax=unclassified Corynebacterium TaxID=2624378 RepID=UPI0021674DE7|nr:MULTISPECIES: fumarylacetoacetate hydrolase family protein [unclassified Corynebacterium]MCS4489769.1 fumarylacetoacetate hydrolase family protein [Corynebacterium sp. ES2775-CONJ]MCS4491867.1 fumarylacetoacetate hydrolase family protein [Corynebacterium sp. ES2715-CONJ3]MCU9519373.1 fumarylacetoacetate hydrolase family protein [Corynebacterium sp. ES2794-CONJ1]
MRFGRIATPDGMFFCTVESRDDKQWCRVIEGTPFTSPRYSGKEYPLEEVKVLAPMLPSKIVAVGRNYADHVRELFGKTSEELPPTLFLKPPTAVVGPEAPIRIPDFAHNVEFEGELGLVIAKPCKNVSANNWRQVVLGYTIVNDVSSRSLQFSDHQWARAKGIDTFAPIGPWIETDLDAIDTEDVPIRAYLTHEGETVTKQNSNSREMIMDIGEIIEFITASMTLLPGDIIFTGSPAGTAEMVPGDRIEIEIPGLGKLANPVERA